MFTNEQTVGIAKQQKQTFSETEAHGLIKMQVNYWTMITYKSIWATNTHIFNHIFDLSPYKFFHLHLEKTEGDIERRTNL